MGSKPKVAFYWCASCGGCEEAVVDLAEAVLDVVAAVDIVFWPVAMDFKRSDVEALPDDSIFATFLNGAIRSTEQQEMAHLLRSKSKLLVAFGSCAQLGGIPGLANLFEAQEILQAAYCDPTSNVNPEGVLPLAHCKSNGYSLELPEFSKNVRTLDQVVAVDYYVPGCPPTSKMLANAVQILLGAELPPRGSVLAPDRALCEECPRKDSKPEKLSLAGFKRVRRGEVVFNGKCSRLAAVSCSHNAQIRHCVPTVLNMNSINRRSTARVVACISDDVEEHVILGCAVRAYAHPVIEPHYGYVFQGVV